MHGSHGMHSGGASGGAGPTSMSDPARRAGPQWGNGEIPTQLRDLIRDVQTVTDTVVQAQENYHCIFRRDKMVTSVRWDHIGLYCLQMGELLELLICLVALRASCRHSLNHFLGTNSEVHSIESLGN
jgi:hypothetical protein